MERRSFLKNTRAGRHSRRRLRAGVRADAPTVKWRCASSFPEDPRHDLRRGGDRRQGASATSPAASSRSRCSRRARSFPALQVADAVQNGTVECGHTAPYYYFGKDPTFAFGTRHSVRPERSASRRVVVHRRRRGALQRVHQGLQHRVDPVRQHRRADGRLVPQGDQDRRRPEGPQDSASAASPARC